MQYWERDAKRRTVPYGAVDKNLPPMQLHEALGQSEPQPGAFGLPRPVLAELLELLEERSLVLGRDPHPGVSAGAPSATCLRPTSISASMP